MVFGTVDAAKPVGQNHLCITARREIYHRAKDLRAAYPV
jgi:hypothetical protein